MSTLETAALGRNFVVHEWGLELGGYFIVQTWGTEFGPRFLCSHLERLRQGEIL
jgi:hypothetical protein